MTTLFVASLLCGIRPAGGVEAAPAGVRLTRGPQNHLLVSAQVNGKPATLMLDTASKINFLQADRASELGVRATGAELRSGGRPFPAGVIDDFRIGPFGLGSTTVGLFDPVQFRGPVPGTAERAADGMIGLDLLRKYGAIVNCRTQELFFARAGGRAFDLAAATRTLGFARIPLQPTVRGLLTVPCTIRSKSGALAVDTGSFVTVFDAAAIHSLDLERDESRLRARTPTGRVRALELARIEHLRIGGVQIEPQRFAVMDMFPKKRPLRAFTGINRLEVYDPRLLKARLDVWGLLGNELLYQHHAIIDLERMVLYLK